MDGFILGPGRRILRPPVLEFDARARRLGFCGGAGVANPWWNR
jgi:hypothetical protein